MRRSSIIAAGLVLLLSGCRGTVDGPSEGKVFFEFGTATRAAANESDKVITIAQVAVFDGDSQVGYGRVSPGKSAAYVEITGLPMGKTLDCYALANVQESIEGLGRAEIESMETGLEEFSPESIPMYASGSKAFSGTDNVMEMTLRRAASKVRVESVTSAFENDKVAAAGCTVSSMYLKCAPGRYRVSLGDPASQRWYHEEGLNGSDSEHLGAMSCLLADTSLGGDISGRGSWRSVRDFYCCPSSEVRTSLVVTVTLAGRDYSYEVALPELRPNTEYIIRDLVLRGLDIEEPEDPTELFTVSITVADWDTGEAISMDY